MKKRCFRAADTAGFAVGAALLAVLVGCLVNSSGQRGGNRGSPNVQVQATVAVQDDYDYFPGYETYYSRNRHEYVYRDGNNWVRQSAPRGVSASVLLAAPSVRLDFHDSPEQHHASVVRSYPKNWTPPDRNRAVKDDRKPDDKGDNKRDNRKD